MTKVVVLEMIRPATSQFGVVNALMAARSIPLRQ
jgi:hypothetical protein